MFKEPSTFQFWIWESAPNLSKFYCRINKKQNTFWYLTNLTIVCVCDFIFFSGLSIKDIGVFSQYFDIHLFQFCSWICQQINILCSLQIKVYIFWEDLKILQNLHQLFEVQYSEQIIVGDFAKFRGLFRIYELYRRLL